MPPCLLSCYFTRTYMFPLIIRAGADTPLGRSYTLPLTSLHCYRCARRARRQGRHGHRHLSYSAAKMPARLVYRRTARASLSSASDDFNEHRHTALKADNNAHAIRVAAIALADWLFTSRICAT